MCACLQGRTSDHENYCDVLIATRPRMLKNVTVSLIIKLFCINGEEMLPGSSGVLSTCARASGSETHRHGSKSRTSDRNSQGVAMQ